MDIGELFKDKELRKLLLVFLAIKMFVIIIAVSTQFFVPEDITHTEKITDNIFLNPFAQYDATAYLYIAEKGYTNDFSSNHLPNYHWYPLYPLLIRFFSLGGYPLAAFLISNAASFAAIAVLYLLVKEELGKKKSYKTTLYISLFPTSFYFTMMYTESLFFLLSLLVFYYAKHGRWAYAGIAGFVCTLTRMQGMLLLIPIAYIYMRDRKFKFKNLDKNAFFLLLLPLGMLTFMAYEYTITGNLFVQFSSAVGFGKYLSPPWDGFIQAINAIATDHSPINVIYHVYNLFVVLAFISLTVMSYGRVKLEYTMYLAFSILIILFSSNLFGASRYFLIAFPAFMTLSILEEKSPKLKYAIYLVYTLFFLVMAASIVLHVTERASFDFLYMKIF